MPVRSRGSLLAGTAAFASLIMAGAGCQTHTTDHDAFANPNNPGQVTSGLLSGLGGSARVATNPAQTVTGYAPMPTYNQATGPVALQPVPANLASGNREVIASTWQPVQRVSAEQSAYGPELNGGASAALPNGTGRLLPVRSPAGAPMPVGPSGGIFIGNGPAIDNGTAAPPTDNITLPPPRVLGGQQPVMTYAGPMPPAHPPGPGGMPREFEKMALPPYVVEPPDILLIQASDNVTLRLQRIEGQHLVGPDGTINLGIYGKIRVVGMTLDQVSDAVAARLLEIMPGLSRGMKAVDAEGKELKNEVIGGDVWRKTFSGTEMIKKELQVDVLAYNSKVYYVITDGGGYGQQVYPIPITGNETVLDAIAKVNGLPAVSSKKKIWVARATRAGQAPKVLPVDWKGVTECGSSSTNYQIFPGDRVYVQSDAWIRADTWLSKRLSPVLRGLGATLLGASTVNSIKNGSSSGLGGLSGLSGVR